MSLKVGDVFAYQKTFTEQEILVKENNEWKICNDWFYINDLFQEDLNSLT